LKKARNILKKFENIPRSKPSGVEVDIQGKSKENYKISKEEIVNSERANREGGKTQQRQVTETIVREMPKINRNDTVKIQEVATGKIEEMKFKKAESLLASGQWVLVN
jgi:preprotein translocase subunit SecA